MYDTTATYSEMESHELNVLWSNSYIDETDIKE